MKTETTMFWAELDRADKLFIVELANLEAPVVLAAGESMTIRNDGKRVSILMKRKPLV